jgi:hypothetical protein
MNAAIDPKVLGLTKVITSLAKRYEVGSREEKVKERSQLIPTGSYPGRDVLGIISCLSKDGLGRG